VAAVLGAGVGMKIDASREITEGSNVAIPST
jgi:hypothetical protein